MSSTKEQLEAIKDIRKMMQESSKFLSLSGFSGIFAGIYALIGAWLGNYILEQNSSSPSCDEPYELISISVMICLAVLFLSLITAYYFSARKAKKNGVKLFDKTTLKLLFNMSVPLSVGGIFSFALLYHGGDFIYLIAPVMLLFYGIALINGSKYTFHEIKILGLLEITLGILALFFVGYGLIFWSIGFGVLHIIYGSLVWYKHERNNS